MNEGDGQRERPIFVVFGLYDQTLLTTKLYTCLRLKLKDSQSANVALNCRTILTL